MKGNVIDMAVGIVIGGAFGKIVTSLVNDLLMPCIGALIGGFDFANLKVTLCKAVMEVHKKQEEAPAAPAPKPDDVVLLEEIRDLLKNKS